MKCHGVSYPGTSLESPCRHVGAWTEDGNTYCWKHIPSRRSEQKKAQSQYANQRRDRVARIIGRMMLEGGDKEAAMFRDRFIATTRKEVGGG